MHKVAEIQGKSPKSLVMSLAKYEAIIHHLQHPEFKVEPHFKHWVKTRRFQLLDIPEEDERQVLVIPKDKLDKVSVWSIQVPMPCLIPLLSPFFLILSPQAVVYSI